MNVSKYIKVYEKYFLFSQIHLKLVPKGPTGNKSALVLRGMS